MVKMGTPSYGVNKDTFARWYQKKIQKKIQKEKKEKSLFSVVLDKMCVFCLYPILDSQQYVKRGSCRHLILSLIEDKGFATPPPLPI